MGVVDYETARERHLGGTFLTAPTDGSKVSDWAATLLLYRPSAVISTERLGPNDKGIIHPEQPRHRWLAANGRPLARSSRPSARRVHRRRRRPRQRARVWPNPPGGQGDPSGSGCRCECGGGMATVVETDVLVTATMSNWGCYGIEAMLAFLLGSVDLDARRRWPGGSSTPAWTPTGSRRCSTPAVHRRRGGRARA